MKNKTPEIIARKGCPIQILEMNKFLRLAIKENVSHYVEELFYDSNSDCCNFKLNEIVEHGDPIYNKIVNIAQITITQYEILDTIGHAKWA